MQHLKIVLLQVDLVWHNAELNRNQFSKKNKFNKGTS